MPVCSKAGRIGKFIQQKIEFTQMLRVFSVDTSNTCVTVSISAQQGQYIAILPNPTVGDKIKFPLPTQKVVLKSLQSR